MGESAAIHEFIESQMDCLLTDWECFARKHLPAADRLDTETLRDGAEAILRAVVAHMRSHHFDSEQNDVQLNATAKEHAASRLRTGFTLDQLVSEYRTLRVSVIRHWAKDIGAADQQTLEQFVRFDQALDQSFTEAVRSFNQRLERARDLFAGMLAHDLRDPLNGILAVARSQQEPRSSMTQRDAAVRIERSAHRMSELVTDLLDFARSRLGQRLPISPEPMDIGDCCRQILEEVGLSIRDRVIQLECSGDLTGTWDPDRIKQLCSNLVWNAVRHSDATFPITISARGESAEATLSVHNIGPPIRAEDHRLIFDPLSRPINTGEKGRLPHNGAGLGLYIVKEIAKAHGGKVHLTSTAEEGTTFLVHLPRRFP